MLKCLYYYIILIIMLLSCMNSVSTPQKQNMYFNKINYSRLILSPHYRHPENTIKLYGIGFRNLLIKIIFLRTLTSVTHFYLSDVPTYNRYNLAMRYWLLIRISIEGSLRSLSHIFNSRFNRCIYDKNFFLTHFRSIYWRTLKFYRTILYRELLRTN